MSEINFTQLSGEIERYESAPERGLTAQQVQSRHAQELTNKVKSPNSKTY